MARRAVSHLLARRGYRLVPVEQEDPYLRRLHTETVPLPKGAHAYLRPDNPRLVALRAAYDGLGWPVCAHSRWQEAVEPQWLNLQFFRGDSAYVWHYRESERVSRLKYYVFLRYVLDRDDRDLVARLGEDGLFGCWVYEFPGCPAVSRDLLDSVNELCFLDRHLSVFAHESLRIVDVGAGYGRLAHRTAQALPGLSDYACLDAVPESTFLTEYYMGVRTVAPPVRVVELPDVPRLEPGRFDLAVNLHAFSECPRTAVAWWLEHLQRLNVPRLFIVPNEPEGFLSTEVDGSRLDYSDLIRAAGYVLVAEERVFADDAVRELMGIDDRFCLFERPG